MSETKKYVSIPTIDNCKLPNSLIRKCKEVYNRYGKWKLYDIINADLNNHVKYTHEERERFKKIELTKRYLYLYRRAMAETLSFAYNVDETDLLDEETLEFDNTNVCPYCGRPLTLLTQIGSKKGFPKSHYNDVVKTYDKLVLFNQIPVRESIQITLSEFLNVLSPNIQVGYSFAFWSLYDKNYVDVNELEVNPDDPTTRLTEEDLASMDSEAKDALVPQGSINLFDFIDKNETITDISGTHENDNYGNLKVYAVYKSDTDTAFISSEFIATVSIQDLFDIYVSNLKVDNEYKPAFNFLTTKDQYYNFKYLVLDDNPSDEEIEEIPEQVSYSDIKAVDYINDNKAIDVIVVYGAKDFTGIDVNYATWNMTIRQLAIQVFKEPYLNDIIYESTFADDGKTLIPKEGTEEKIGIYNFFHWSLKPEGDIFILEDDDSLNLVRSVNSVIDSDTFTIYGLFKYDIKLGTYAYDDDCYSSIYHQYKGIDRAYDGYTNPRSAFVYEYRANSTYEDQVNADNKLLDKREFGRLPLYSKLLYIQNGDKYELPDMEYIHKETVDGHEQLIEIPYRITEEEYNDLPSGPCRCIYDEQKSLVSYRGYPVSPGVANSAYIKNNMIRVIRYNAISKNGNISIENGKKYQKFSNKGDTGVELTYTTPGNFEIWYNIPRYLWYLWDESIDADKGDSIRIVWVYNSAPNDESRYVYDGDPVDGTEYYTKYICARLINRSEYLTLTTEQKNSCVINRVYYEHEWQYETYDVTDSNGNVVDHKIYEIQEIFNCKSISEYNTQVGTANGSFGVDTKTYADMTRETYRIYQYNLSLDKNAPEGLDASEDNEISFVEEACNLEYIDGDTWLYPITPDNREDFLELILGANTRVVQSDARFVRNGKAIFFACDINDIINEGEEETDEEREARLANLDYTRLRPTDNTGINQLYYSLTGLWKCAMFTNGMRLIYRAGDRHWPTVYDVADYTPTKPTDKIQLKDLVYKYTASLSVNIENSINEDTNEYEIWYNNIIITAPGASNQSFFNNNNEDVLLVDTVAGLSYTTKPNIESFDTLTQYVKYSENPIQTAGHGVSYVAHLTKDTLRAHFEDTATKTADEQAREFFEKLKSAIFDPEAPNYYELINGEYERTDGNLKYPILKDLDYDDLDNFSPVSSGSFLEDVDSRYEYYYLDGTDFKPLTIDKFNISNYKITGLAQPAYIKGIYLHLDWEDIASVVTQVTTINGIQIETLREPMINPMLYRAETDVELDLRKQLYHATYGIDPDNGEETETQVTIELSGMQTAIMPDDPTLNTYEDRVYSRWGSSSAAIMDDRRVVVSGGYPDPSVSKRSDRPMEGQFIEESVEFVLNRSAMLLMTRSSVSMSGDAQSAIEAGDDEPGASRPRINELDERVWWNQFSKELYGKDKNDFITDYGVNFSGWIWKGWKTPYAEIDGQVVIGGTDKLVEGGLIEAYPFDNSTKANYVSQGFQRILFPNDVNPTFEAEQYDTEESIIEDYEEVGTKIITRNRTAEDGNKISLVNRIDPMSGEPSRLLRYCGNQACELFKKRLDKRKWSFQDPDATIRVNDTSNSNLTRMSLDEFLLPIGKDGSFKGTKANKFAADEPDPLAKFGISDTPKLVTVSGGEGEYEYGGWTLDTYPWTYRDKDGNGNYKYNEYVRYYLHRGGAGLPDPFRFEFEYKYATNEFSPTKMSSYGTGITLDDTSTQLDTIKQIDHRPKNKIIPMDSRPIEEYQNKYRDVIFNTFESTFIRLNTNSSPYSQFSEEEVYVLNEILGDLFTFDKDVEEEHQYDFITFKLDIVQLMNDIAEYEFNKANYWHDNDFENNKALLNEYYLRTHSGKTEEDLANLTNVEFENTILGKDIIGHDPEPLFPFYTHRLTEDNWDNYENHSIRRIVIRREYTPAINTTERDILYNIWGGAPSYTGYKFMGWYRDALTFDPYYPDTSEGTNTIQAGTKFVAYLRLDAGTFSEDELGNEVFIPGSDTLIGSFIQALLAFNEGNEIYLKVDVVDTPTKLWYDGEDAIVTSIKTRLAELHEKLMLPAEFMCCLFNFIVSPKHYNILEDSDGAVKSLFVPAGIVTSADSNEVLSIARAADSSRYTGAVITKPWNMAKDDETGRAVKEQYYILYNNHAFDAYSFFNEGWLRDIYGEESASAKFPLYRDTENPIIHNASNDYTILNIIPFTTEEYESALALVYNNGILMVNLTGLHTDMIDTQWIKQEDGEKVLSPMKLFSNSSVSIVDCILDNTNGDNNLIIISSNSQIATYDLNTKTIYNPNNPSTRSALPSPIHYKPDDNVIGSSVITKRSLGKAISPVNESEATLIGENGDRYIEKRVGLSVIAGTLIPVAFDGNPWILNEQFVGSGLAESVSDVTYENLSDEEKEKYHIHPKLTVRYAWNTQAMKDYVPETTIDYEYINLYTGEFTPSTEGTFKIYHGGSQISKNVYFGYSDDLRAECDIYKVETINYTFVRLSFANDGTAIYDEQFDARLKSEKRVYAFYYKTGVEVDELYGYKIKITEHIVDGKDTITSDEFDEYLNNGNRGQTEDFTTVRKIAGWKLVNQFTDYKKNIVDNIEIIANLRKIFPINGYVDSATDTYIHQYIISDNEKCQLIQWYDGTIHIVCEYDYQNGIPLVGVKTRNGEIDTYLIYKNQRIVKLETYEYVPTELFPNREDNIDFFVKTDNPLDETSISYVTTDKRVVNLSLSNSGSATTDKHTIYKETVERRVSSKAVSLINCEIQQTEPFRYISNHRQWLVLPANDRS